MDKLQLNIVDGIGDAKVGGSYATFDLKQMTLEVAVNDGTAMVDFPKHIQESAMLITRFVEGTVLKLNNPKFHNNEETKI